MSTFTSVREAGSGSATRPLTPILTALEVALLYAGILLYIWRWQFTHPRLWMLLWALVLLSHVLHRDSLRALGLTATELRSSAQLVLTLALAVFLPLLLYGFARHTLVLVLPGRQALLSFLSYAAWCVFQQYLAQSFFYRRLRSVVRIPHLSAALVGVMFGAAHIPNPLLMVVTTLGGFVLAEIFARHPNIWPLALAQAVGGFLLAALVPDSLLHHMRVGPAYFFYGHR
jgi:hypothetical protein